jgi:chemotaxis signal transduction protein
VESGFGSQALPLPSWTSELFDSLLRGAGSSEPAADAALQISAGGEQALFEPIAEAVPDEPRPEAHEREAVVQTGLEALLPPSWTTDLFESLVRSTECGETVIEAAAAESSQETVPDEPEASAAAAAEEIAQRAAWELMSSLPAPAPPSFSEPMLFEPPLPPDSVFDWPVVEQRVSLAQASTEGETFEEAEAETEVETDDSLRRLVGQMLAEMAASAKPSDQSPNLDAGTAHATERFLSFSLAGEVYAVALAGILETDRLPRVTRVPGLPAWVIGVTNLRGSILPVVDLRRLLSLEEAENPLDGRILVVRPTPGDAPAALVVDRLEGIALLAPSELHPAPQWLDNKVLPYLEGIGSFKGRLVNVLDLGRLFGATGVSGEEPARAGESVSV